MSPAICICNDVSEREFQLERSGQWVKGKSAPTFGPLGPWLVTPDEIKDVQGARHVARRQRRAHADRLDRDDGVRRQDARLLHLAVHDPRARRRHHHRHAARRRIGQEAAAVPQGRRHDVARASMGSGSKPSTSSRGRRIELKPNETPAVVDGRRLRRRSTRWRSSRSMSIISGAAGAWFADLPLSLAALPFTLVMRALNGGVIRLSAAT